MNQVPEDQVGLFEFFEAVWDGKALIARCIVIALLLAGAFIVFKTPVYESKLIYKVDSMPPFYETADQRIAMRDFTKLLYTQTLFDDWKRDNQDSMLIYNDFRDNQVVDGVKVYKHEDNRTAILDKDKKIGAYILIRSNQLELLNDFFNYANYINNILTSEYILRAKEEITIIDKRFNDISATTDIITSKLLAIDRYIMEAEKGANVLILLRPEYPAKVSPKVNLVLVIASFLGILIGIFYIFIKDAIRMRKHHISKTGDIS